MWSVVVRRSFCDVGVGSPDFASGHRLGKIAGPSANGVFVSDASSLSFDNFNISSVIR